MSLIMDQITAVIITHNEELNIARCLQSLDGVADEIIVVDSGSTDQTQQICTHFNFQLSTFIFQLHPWEGYSAQKNYANSLASHAWILSIDADEALSPQLRDSILSAKNAGLDPHTAYVVNRLTNYCGHWIRHSGWYPDHCTRLFHKDAAHWDGLIHEQLTFHFPHTSFRLKGPLHHYSFHSFDDHALRTVKYATLAGEQAFQQGKHPRPVALKTAATFFRNYILHLGFLDGRPGYTVCKMSAFYTFIKYTTLRELTAKGQY